MVPAGKLLSQIADYADKGPCSDSDERFPLSRWHVFWLLVGVAIWAQIIHWLMPAMKGLLDFFFVNEVEAPEGGVVQVASPLLAFVESIGALAIIVLILAAVVWAIRAIQFD